MGKRVDELETLKVGEFLYDVGNRTRRIKVPLFLARIAGTSLNVKTAVLSLQQDFLAQAVFPKKYCFQHTSVIRIQIDSL